MKALEGSLRVFRSDGVGQNVLDAADTPQKKNTLLVAAASCAAGTDTRTFFERKGFTVDAKFYEYRCIAD